ncbi:hypothetical protein QYG89_10635 [Bacillus sp. B190/17]|uniref:ATPase n=1 Tax=Bacillus lumedeiriae TaxID=3058829 RepID=A0ABW8IAV9_9BACI
MKRDVIYTNGLVIAADNSGSVGEKKGDTVQAEYEMVGYFSARVALMECLAAGGEPFAAVIHNFAGEEAWSKLRAGIEQAAREAECSIQMTGSTETNFTMSESAAGITVIGSHARQVDDFDCDSVCYGVIGKPLVGLEVLAEPHAVAPLYLFRKVIEIEGVRSILPVGSKGILHEWRIMSGHTEMKQEDVECSLDIEKSAGPATCFLVGFDRTAEKALKVICAGLYSEIKHSMVETD